MIRRISLKSFYFAPNCLPLKVPPSTYFQLFIFSFQFAKSSKRLDTNFKKQHTCFVYCFSFLLKPMLCFSFYVLGRRPKQGSRETVRELGMALGVIINWGEASVAFVMSLRGDFQNCLLAHKLKQAEDVKDGLFSFLVLFSFTNSLQHIILWEKQGWSEFLHNAGPLTKKSWETLSFTWQSGCIS